MCIRDRHGAHPHSGKGQGDRPHRPRRGGVEAARIFKFDAARDMDDAVFGFEFHRSRDRLMLLRKYRDEDDVGRIGDLLVGLAYRYPLREKLFQLLRLPAVFMHRKNDPPCKFRRGTKPAHKKRSYAAGADKTKCQIHCHKHTTNNHNLRLILAPAEDKTKDLLFRGAFT